MKTYKTNNANETVKATYFVADTFSKDYSASKFESDSKEECDKFISENNMQKGYGTYAVAQYEFEGSVEGETVAMTIEQAIRDIEAAMCVKVFEEKTPELADALEVLNGDDEDAKNEVAPVICETQKGDLTYTARADSDNWYINFNTGLGWGAYPKKDWSLGEALLDDNF